VLHLAHGTAVIPKHGFILHCGAVKAVCLHRWSLIFDQNYIMTEGWEVMFM